MSTRRVLNLPEVKRLTGLSTTMIYNKMNLKEFPRPVKLGERRVGWDSEKIEAWINDLLGPRPVASAGHAEREDENAA